MLARGFDFIADREIFDQFDISYEGAARQRTFEQIMAENSVFLDLALDRGLEGVDVVEALASERAFTSDVLVDVRNGEDVRVDAAIGGEDALEGRKLIPFWRGKGREGINLKRVFTEPRTFDLVLWIQGTAAVPYLEKGELANATNLRTLEQLLGGQVFMFSMWSN